jgi:predicted esterase
VSEIARRIKKIPFETQDYVSHQYGDARIDCYVTEPANAITTSTGMMLLIHGWGNDGSKSYEDESFVFADTFDLVVVRVEYRDCGREAHHPVAPLTFDRPYDFSKLQTIDCLRAAYTVLNRYPQLDRRRLLLWGGSQGAHIVGQCLVFAPELWASAVLCCGLYIPMTYDRQIEGGFTWDVRKYSGMGFVEYALGAGETFTHEHEFDIRNTVRNAHLVSAGVQIALIHGTVDDNVDIRHAVEFYARLRAHDRDASLFAIANGDHGLGGAEAEDENSRLKATFKHAQRHLRARAANPAHWSDRTEIPVTDGLYSVEMTALGPTLRFELEHV